MSAGTEQTVLGIDTSTILGGVALVRDGRLLGEVRCDARAAASERILPQIQHLLADLGLDRTELTRIGVALGPGSFTGLRVGLATAKGLGHSLAVPVVGISSLRARVFGLGAIGRAVLVVSALRRGSVFAGAEVWDGKQFRVLLPAAARAMEEAPAWVAAVVAAADRPPLLCSGDAAPALLAQLAAAGKSPDACLPVAGPPGALPGAVALLAARAPAEALLQGEALDALVPTYLRGADARRPAVRPAQ